jgi:predicted Zn-ribbon and HTH transcriptional regulator
MDTTIRECKICGYEFDSIWDIDEGICDECREKQEKEADKILEEEGHIIIQ